MIFIKINISLIPPSSSLFWFDNTHRGRERGNVFGWAAQSGRPRGCPGRLCICYLCATLKLSDNSCLSVKDRADDCI